MDTGFRVEQIDHVEVLVPNVEKAAEWYERVLGLAPVPDLPWSEPVMLSSDGGSTKLALFEGRPQEGNVGWRRVAFRVSGTGFREILSRLDDVSVFAPGGSRVGADDVVDHEVSFSIYFTDPFGNRLEITTYDYEEVATALAS
jgi:catechol 2,3-dioxygenase-like lactoylglutathione lyase family enzyme